MFRTSELAQKDVITIKEGRNLGPISDIEINLEEGRVDALVIPGRSRLLGFFSRENDYIVSWKDIVKIGVDVILVEFRDAIEPDTGKESDL